MSATIIRCPRCQSILGNAVGDFHLFMTAWSHRSYVVRGLSFIVCDDCGGTFSPRPLGKRDQRSLERIVADSSARIFRCLTDGCGHVLGQIGIDQTTGKPIAITKAAKRVLVCESIVFASCPDCRAGWEAPFQLYPPPSIVSAADEAAMTRQPAAGAAVAASFASSPLPRPVVPATRVVTRTRGAERIAKAFGTAGMAAAGALTARPPEPRN